jgi:hypothetical protein
VTNEAAASRRMGSAIPTLPKTISARAMRRQAAAKRRANTEVGVESRSAEAGMSGRIWCPKVRVNASTLQPVKENAKGRAGVGPGTHLVVTDIEAARAELVERGVNVSEIRHLVGGEWVAGPDPEHRDYASFADFSDPDDNSWVLQERGHSQPET